MNRKVVAILCVGLLSASGCLLIPVSADDFEVMWFVNLPRQTFFVGETVTFTITAFASTDPTVHLPGEMAQVTIRNQSMVEVFSAWVTTNQNGSVPVSWEMGLLVDSGNYTIILQPIGGKTITEEFVILYNEETYWKIRVDQLQDEVDQQYEYLNYLFATSNYLKKKVNTLRTQVWVAGIVMMITIMATLSIAIPEWSRRGRITKGRRSISGSLAKWAGLTNTPKVMQTEHHEEIGQLKNTPYKRPPRHGLEHHCPICDKDEMEPMTANALAEHIKVTHTGGLGGWQGVRAWRRNRIYKSIIKEDYKVPEEPEIIDAVQPLEIRRQELIDRAEASDGGPEIEDIRNEMLEVEAERKINKPEKVKKSKKDKKIKPPKIRRRDRPKKVKEPKPEKEPKPKKQKVKKPKRARRKLPSRKQLLKETLPPNPLPQRKVRRLKHISGIPSETPTKPHSNNIDDLFEKLSKEQVK